MRSTIALSVAALAGSALAAPSYDGYANSGYGNNKPALNVHYDVVVETVVHTVYVTEGYEAYKPKPTSTSTEVKPVYQAPKTTMVYKPAKPATSSAVYSAPAYTPEAPKPTTTVVYTPTPTPEAPAPTSEAPEPTTEAPKPTSSAPAAEPTTGGYMDIVSEWRAKMGMKELECDPMLEKNAQKVVEDGNGVMRHELNDGTMGQVLAPGDPDMKSFLHVFVGGWLCEIPSLPGLDGVCSTMSDGWSYEGQTGHAEILTSDAYTKIGCRNHKGIWCCDLA